MSLDPQALEVLAQLAKYQPPAVETLSPEQARDIPLLDYAARDLLAARVDGRLFGMISPWPEQVGSIRHRSIPGPGGELLLRLYTPKGRGPFPVLVYFHGGGWVIAGLDAYDASARALCNAAGCIVASVAYRLAPEHKFPAGVEDAFAATRWVMANAAEVKGDPARVAVAGESAGGNLAAVVCLMAKERGTPLPVHQLLIYPATQFSVETASYKEHAHAVPLYSAMLPWFKRHYLRKSSDERNPHAAPLLAPDLSGLPPATVITAEYDPLRDDGRLYADRLREAGVPVAYHHYEGMMHDFFGLGGLVDEAKDAVGKAARSLSGAFEERRSTARVRRKAS